MKIQVEREIFDDQFSCGKIGNNERCPQRLIAHGEYYCEIFPDGELKTKMMSVEKHQQCKEAWKKAKELEELPTFTEQEIFEHNINCKLFVYNSAQCEHDSKTTCSRCDNNKQELNNMDNSAFEQ